MAENVKVYTLNSEIKLFCFSHRLKKLLKKKVDKAADKVKTAADQGNCGFYTTVIITLKCLNIGTPKINNFPFVPTGKLMVLGAPVFKHIYE